MRLTNGIEVTTYIPGVGPQPPGALDRLDPRRSRQGPAGCALSRHPRNARLGRCRRTASRGAPSTAPSARRPKENACRDAESFPSARSCRIRSTTRSWSPSSSTRDACRARSRSPSASCTGRSTRVAEKTQDDPMKVFKKAIENVKPAVEVKSRRVGGSTYQVPVEVQPEPPASLVDPLDHPVRDRSAARRRCGRSSRASCWTPRKSRRRDQEEGRHPPDGRGQQGLRPLSLVSSATRRTHVTTTEDEAEPRLQLLCRRTTAPLNRHPQHRHHGSHRRR